MKYNQRDSFKDQKIKKGKESSTAHIFPQRRRQLKTSLTTAKVMNFVYRIHAFIIWKMRGKDSLSLWLLQTLETKCHAIIENRRPNGLRKRTQWKIERWKHEKRKEENSGEEERHRRPRRRGGEGGGGGDSRRITMERKGKERILQSLLSLSPPFLRVTLRDVNYRAIWRRRRRPTGHAARYIDPRKLCRE